MLRGYVFELFMNAFFPDFHDKKVGKGTKKSGGSQEKKASMRNKVGVMNPELR